jgi:hypothetical protein
MHGQAAVENSTTCSDACGITYECRVVRGNSAAGLATGFVIAGIANGVLHTMGFHIWATMWERLQEFISGQ